MATSRGVLHDKLGETRTFLRIPPVDEVDAKVAGAQHLPSASCFVRHARP